MVKELLSLIGRRVMVTTYRGKSRDMRVGVIYMVRDTRHKPISMDTWRKNKITRSVLLITVGYNNDYGGIDYRSYYSDHASITFVG
jgi:hypothetical protein